MTSAMSLRRRRGREVAVVVSREVVPRRGGAGPRAHDRRDRDASTSGLTSLHNATDAPAWRRMAGSSRRAEPGQQRHGHRAGLVDGEIRDQPLERLIGRRSRGRPGSPVRPQLLEPPGESIGLAVPPTQGEIGAIGQVSPGHGIGKQLSELGDQLCLQQSHGARTGSARWTGWTGQGEDISRRGRLRGRCEGCRRASA